MECFFLFDFQDENLTFHAEYCTERAVHTLDGVVPDVPKLYAATGASDKEDLLKFLTVRYSSGNGFFDFLKEHGIAFVPTEKSYADTSSDV